MQRSRSRRNRTIGQATIPALAFMVAALLASAVPVPVWPRQPDTAAATPAPHNRIGTLTVVRAFLPLPPSPNVASIYLTIKNSGSRPDVLVAATTPEALASMLMTDHSDGSMSMLRYLIIPAHGQASLVPGHNHLMLEVPTTTMSRGRRVPVTLRFLHAGVLVITVPVVPLSWIEQGHRP